MEGMTLIEFYFGFAQNVFSVNWDFCPDFDSATENIYNIVYNFV